MLDSGDIQIQGHVCFRSRPLHILLDFFSVRTKGCTVKTTLRLHLKKELYYHNTPPPPIQLLLTLETAPPAIYLHPFFFAKGMQ